MAITNWRSGPYPPNAPVGITNPQHPTGITLDAAGKYNGFVFYPPKSGNIRKLWARFSTVTTPGNCDFRVEGVDASGMPSGTLLATNTNIIMAISAANSWYTGTLTADAAVTPEVPIAVLFKNSTGSYVSQLARSQMSCSSPYRVHDVGAGGVKAGLSDQPNFFIEYDDGSIGYIGTTMPGSIGTINVQTGSTPNEYAMLWTPPVGVRCHGMRLFTNFSQDFTATLYNTDGQTIMERIVVDKDIGSALIGVFNLFWNTPQTLVAASSYRLAILATTAVNQNIAVLTLPSAAARDATAFGTEFQKSTRTNSADTGAWTDVNTDLLMWLPLVNGIDIPVAAAQVISMVE